MSIPVKRSSPSPCLWQNILLSQWERDYPANTSVTNRASLKLIFWHWWGSFIAMDCCKLHHGVSSSLPSSLSVSSSNRSADRHTRDRAGKWWEMLFHWQLVPRQVCICFCLLPMKYYGSKCAIRVGAISCEIKKHTAGIGRPLEEFTFSVAVKWDTRPVVQQDGSVLPHSEGGCFLGRSFAGTPESFSLTGASWWAFPSAALLQLISDPAESPSASCWRVIPSDTSHCMDQTAFKPAS